MSFNLAVFMSWTVVYTGVQIKNSSSDNPAHSIHEMYDYDWSKLTICLICIYGGWWLRRLVFEEKLGYEAQYDNL